jgi:hypothetical protein
VVLSADGSVLFLVAVIGLWGTLLLLLAEQAVRETVAWWHRRHQHGNHHPTGPAARTVDEIQCRLRREADHPARSIVIRHRMVTPPPATPLTRCPVTTDHPAPRPQATAPVLAAPQPVR